MADTIVCLNQALGNKKILIKRLLKMLCGIKQNRTIAIPKTMPTEIKTIVARIVQTNLVKG